MKRLFLIALLLVAAPATAEDLVSGISQDTIQITSNYTGTDIVVFGAIERDGQAASRAGGSPNRCRSTPLGEIMILPPSMPRATRSRFSPSQITATASAR